MTQIQHGVARRGPSAVKLTVWMGACALLLAPLVAMQFTREVVWTGGDFLVFGTMLAGALGLYEFTTRRAGSNAYRWATGIAVATGFFLVWTNLAVGLIGREDNPANMMFVGVLAIPLLGAFGTSLRAGGMVHVLRATALAQLIVGVVALTGNLGADGAGWPRDVIGLTAVFTILWLVAAVLFGRAARQEMAA